MSTQAAPKCGNTLKPFSGGAIVCDLTPDHKTQHHYVAKNGDEQAYIVKWFQQGQEDELHSYDLRPFPCPQCRTNGVYVRGRYPGDERRLVCPQCTQEMVDDLLTEKHSGVGQDAALRASGEK